MLNTTPITPGKLYGCLETLYKLRLPAYLAGPPGIGKSAVVRKFAQEQGLQLVTLMLSQIEPSDVRGLPFLDKDAGRTRWLIPEFYPETDSDSGGILILDELANAEPRVQVAAYQLLLDRKVGEYTSGTAQTSSSRIT
jgi:MoxR-like ATPase